MRLNNLVKNMFMTPTEKKQIDEAYYKKMYPFGKKQQDWEDEVLKEIFKQRANSPTIKYICLLRREMYIDGIAQQQDPDSIKIYNKNLKRMKISQDEAKIIDELVKSEYNAETFEQLPTSEEILSKI